MSSLNRYILRQLTGAFIFLFAALTGVLWLTQSLRTIDLIVNKGLSVGNFFYLTGLLIPWMLTLVLPIALFGAVLFVYYKLKSDQELVVMWSAGIGTSAVARPALYIMAAATALTYLLTLYLMPAGYRTFKEQKNTFRSNLSYLLLQEGAFNTIGSRLTIYVRARQSDGELLGILVHDNRDRSQPVTMMAERGALVETDNGPRIVLVNGNRQQIDRLKEKDQPSADDGDTARTAPTLGGPSVAGQLSMLYFDRYVLDLGQFVETSTNRWREARERYLDELFDPGDTGDDIANRDRFRAEAHNRLVSPLFCVVFTFIALAATLAGQFNRRGDRVRVAFALILALLCRLAGVGFVNAAATVPALTPLIYLNIAVAIGICLFMLRQSGRRLSITQAVRLPAGVVSGRSDAP